MKEVHQNSLLKIFQLTPRLGPSNIDMAHQTHQLMDIEEFTPTMDPTQAPTTITTAPTEEPSTPTPARVINIDMETESPDILAEMDPKPLTRKRPHPPAQESPRKPNFEINFNLESTKQGRIKRVTR